MEQFTKTPLNLPSGDFRIQKHGGNLQIFDTIRKRFVALTPEEWVRQHVVNYLVSYLGVPPGLLSVEVALVVNKVRHRADLVVFSRAAKPLMVIECKATTVQLTSAVVDQVCRYNLKFNAPYVLITNGLQHICVRLNREQGTFQVVKIPQYSEMVDL